MKRYHLLSILLVLISFIACAPLNETLDEKYQPIGSAVFIANDQLAIAYSENPSIKVDGEFYKNLIKDNFSSSYNELEPYRLDIENHNYFFIVRVYDEDLLVLTDYSCTQNYVDCWSYLEQCLPDTLEINCIEGLE